MLLYIYDLKIKGEKQYNALKRRFYYNFNKKIAKFAKKRTKSAILIEEIHEKETDSFFIEYRDFIEVYKSKIQSIEKILEVHPPSI